MLDSSLTPQAKAIYAYFTAFSGAGTTAFPRRTTIMRELRIGSLETYYRHFNQLIEHGYLSVEQRKDNGRFDYCVYHLHDEVLREEMSEKPIHGGKLPSARPAVSEKAMSEKPVSEKLEHQNSGQPDIKNRIISAENNGGPVKSPALEVSITAIAPGQSVTRCYSSRADERDAGPRTP